MTGAPGACGGIGDCSGGGACGAADGDGGTVGKMQVDMLGEAQTGQLSFGYD